MSKVFHKNFSTVRRRLKVYRVLLCDRLTVDPCPGMYHFVHFPSSILLFFVAVSAIRVDRQRLTNYRACTKMNNDTFKISTTKINFDLSVIYSKINRNRSILINVI